MIPKKTFLLTLKAYKLVRKINNGYFLTSLIKARGNSIKNGNGHINIITDYSPLTFWREDAWIKVDVNGHIFVKIFTEISLKWDPSLKYFLIYQVLGCAWNIPSLKRNNLPHLTPSNNFEMIRQQNVVASSRIGHNLMLDRGKLILNDFDGLFPKKKGTFIRIFKSFLLEKVHI